MLSTFSPSVQGQQNCASNPAASATVIQIVRDLTTGVPLRNALVSAEWVDMQQPVRLTTDSNGQARLCIPANRAVTMRAHYRDARAGPETVFAAAERVTVRTAVIDVPGVFFRGVVSEKDNNAPIAGVAVRFVNTPLATATDENGRFHFARIPAGDYLLRAEHLSYAPASLLLEVGDEDLDAIVRLDPTAVVLDPIVVTAFSRRLEAAGFYERQKRGVGTFIGRKRIDAMNVQRASDLLRGVPSTRVIPQPSRRGVPPNVMLGRGDCRYRFIVDGARTLPDFEMDMVAPYAIEGVEVYVGLSEVPALFRAVASDGGSALCGVVVIWTRDRK